MKYLRIVCLSALVALASLLSSCIPLHYEMMPDNYPGSTYYCEDFDIEFTVHDEDFLLLECDGMTDSYSKITGEITVDGITYEFYANFHVDLSMSFYSKEITKEGAATTTTSFEIEEKHRLVSATCDYEPNGDIVATVDGGTLLEPGTKLTFSRK
ncbi:MAG: hypothetical protein IJ309_00830 [Clostridia bacterium]|nr:hypothetical protein [Clostridia bacterium]